MTGRPVVYGADYSVYVRIAKLVLEEKGVGYDLVAIDAFAADGPGEDYLRRHPFGRIPALEHDGFRRVERATAPASILATRQATTICATAALLARPIVRHG